MTETNDHIGPTPAEVVESLLLMNNPKLGGPEILVQEYDLDELLERMGPPKGLS